MSLLVPDYSSSSSDDETPAPAILPRKPPAPSGPSPLPTTSSTASPAVPKPLQSTSKKTKKKSKKKRTKAAVFLPPEIQRLLESGGGGAYSSDSDDGGSELLAKRKQARRAAAASKRPRVASKTDTEAPEPRSAALSFLPPPKHEEEVETKQEEQPANVEDTTTLQTPHSEPVIDQQAESYAQYYDQHTAYTSDYYAYAQEVETPADSSSKRARLRDRELERALQQGQFHAGVLGKIVDVTGPAAGAWQPPAESAGAARPADGELKVSASFWSTQQGARVATAKPNRLQRQKHQLNQLAFDAKAREFELLDKKGSALKTKSETYAKYGW